MRKGILPGEVKQFIHHRTYRGHNSLIGSSNQKRPMEAMDTTEGFMPQPNCDKISVWLHTAP